MKQNVDTDKSTRIPNAVIEGVAPHLTGSALKILLYIFRETWGEDRRDVVLSYREITKGTGVHASSTIGQSLRRLSGPVGDAPAPLDVVRGRGQPSEFQVNPEFVSYASTFNRDDQPAYE